jgi:hypothetical protein
LFQLLLVPVNQKSEAETNNVAIKLNQKSEAETNSLAIEFAFEKIKS